MPGLAWARLDVNIATHDKILDLMDRHGRQKGRALGFGYLCALGYAVGHATDGEVPFSALPIVHLTRPEAYLLVDAGLFELDQRGFLIHNFAERQQSNAVSEQKSFIAQRAACIRHHGPDCWDDQRKRCTKAHADRTAKRTA